MKSKSLGDVKVFPNNPLMICFGSTLDLNIALRLSLKELLSDRAPL